MAFRTTRTVRTVISDGRGPPRVEERTYTNGDDSGGSSGMQFDIGGFSSQFGEFGKQIGKRFGTITIGGGDSGPSRKYVSAGRASHRPGVSGRSTRKEKKNPFSGLGKQSYDEIVKKCLEEGCLFEDPEFPAEDGSIFFSRSPPRPFEWKRPGEVCDAPMYVAEGASRFDVEQGELGDCWLLAAVASLTCNQRLLARVILPEQNFTDNYCGVFRFMIWHQGDWTEVVVDDRLPTYYGSLVFMHSQDKNEFWSALLEKAYAKINGSYESLKGGSTSEAMEDFTGGVTESIDLQKAPTNILSIMMKARDRGSLMGCSIEADPNQLEAKLDNGLVMGHAYSVTAVKLVEIQTPKVSGKIPLVRVRNPWGNECEWTGAWSDSSPEWRYIPDEEKQALGLTFDDDGEFWMSFQDWQNNFQKLEICNLGPDSLDDSESSQAKVCWEATAQVGEWIPRVNAGGCRNFLETFATNPQYRVTLVDPDDDEDDLCTILVGLLQKDRRKKRKEGLDMLTIGYVIYKLKDDQVCGGPVDTRFFKYNASVAKSPSFINMREICGRHKLSPGTYVIIPSTFEPNNAGEFLLRIFTEKAGTTEEMDEGTGIVEDQRRRIEQDYGSSMPDPYAGSSLPDPYADSSLPDPYAGQDPPPLGFDLMTKDEYKAPAPIPYNFDRLGLPASQGYPSHPYQQPDPSQGQGYPQAQGFPQGQGYSPYGGAPAPAAGYQPMPGNTYNQYNPSAGYQPPVDPYYQNQPHPAYNAGYQPSPYCQMPNPGAGPGYQPNQYYNNQYGQPQPGFPQAQVPYSTSGPAPYQPTSQSYGGYGDPSQFPQQPNYPYGQGEAMERAQSASLYCATPGSRADNSTGGMRSEAPARPSRPPRLPSPIIHSYQEAVVFLRKQIDKEGPPVTEEDKAQGQALRESFKQIAGEDLEVDAYELKDILNTVFTKEFTFDGFSVDVCRSMVAMHDGDMSGKLGFDEFKELWQDLRKWKAVFKKFDKDNSGRLSSYELRTALHSSGFRLSNRSLSALILRYSDKNGEIEFDDFVLCSIRLKTMIASFKGAQQREGMALYDIDTFIQTAMYS